MNKPSAENACLGPCGGFVQNTIALSFWVQFGSSCFGPPRTRHDSAYVPMFQTSYSRVGTLGQRPNPWERNRMKEEREFQPAWLRVGVGQLLSGHSTEPVLQLQSKIRVAVRFAVCTWDGLRTALVRLAISNLVTSPHGWTPRPAVFPHTLTHHRRFRSPVAAHSLPARETPPRWWNYSPLQEPPPPSAVLWYLPRKHKQQGHGELWGSGCCHAGKIWEYKQFR